MVTCPLPGQASLSHEVARVTPPYIRPPSHPLLLSWITAAHLVSSSGLGIRKADAQPRGSRRRSPWAPVRPPAPLRPPLRASVRAEGGRRPSSELPPVCSVDPRPPGIQAGPRDRMRLRSTLPIQPSLARENTPSADSRAP
ncbi:hypothetical protein NDU88_003672 [Pleurodeles waltl]|uniref:Uncharacterized protein n=1 Tax=Pleurodeles waltl TaxID=8319 RepID=A0AAV7QCD0_PLEWA|nr:hypothetical protein NDU88_003672 [Pleurodeles waltl]